MTAPIPMDLIERLREMASELGDENDNGLRYKPVAAELCHQASLALSQAQGRIGELEAERERSPHCEGANHGFDASGCVYGYVAARAQAAEGLLKEAGEVVRGMLSHYGPPETVAAICDYPAAHPISRSRAFLSKLSPGEGGGSDVIPEPDRHDQAAIGEAKPSAAEWRRRAEYAEHIWRLRDRQALTTRAAWIRDAEEALAGDPRALRNRLALIAAGPVEIIQSAASASERSEESSPPSSEREGSRAEQIPFQIKDGEG